MKGLGFLDIYIINLLKVQFALPTKRYPYANGAVWVFLSWPNRLDSGFTVAKYNIWIEILTSYC